MPKEVREPLTGPLADLSEQPQETEAGVPGMGRILTSKWVIRDEDLKLLDFVVSGLTAGAAFATGGAILVLGTAVLVATIRLLYALMKKGAKITPVQHKILLALKTNRN